MILDAPTTVACRVCAKRNRPDRLHDGVPHCDRCGAPLAWIVHATGDTFDREIRSSCVVLAEFWAPWCRPSWIVYPLVERIAWERAGRLKVVILDVGKAPGTSERYGVLAVPVFLLFSADSELDRRVGIAPVGQMRQWLASHLLPARAGFGP